MKTRCGYSRTGHLNDTHASTTPTLFTHSQFGGGKFTVYPGSVALTNCLWERVYVTLNDSLEDDQSWCLFNNLFYGGTLSYRARGENPVLLAYDNLFDKTTITKGGGSENFTHDYNGYVTNYSRLTSNGAHDVILTNSPVYQTGYLGSYYYPNSDGNLSRLLDAGSRTVEAAGLRAYATRADQAPDTCQVDIGFHYRIADGDLTVSTNATADELAKLLVPSWVTVANATNTGAVLARGTFTNGFRAGLPIHSGVILSSGNITNAIGPNNDSGFDAYVHESDVMGSDGDTDLDNVFGTNAPYVTHDAAVLEFDIVWSNSFVLEFRYIFASEEYPEWIGSPPDGFNDPMAIFVSTNQIGTSWINTNNIALVPGTNMPVSVNTINGGGTNALPPHTYVSPTNPQYYVDNGDPMYSTNAPVFNIQYDGTTVLLTAQAAILANVTNHIKIAIADYNDSTRDSAVFIKAQCQ